MKRGNGVLAHIASLPSVYGIGSLGKPAFHFIDRLKEANQSYWQVMPCLISQRNNDPYDMVSVFAGNPNLIDLESLADEGYLNKADYAAACTKHMTFIDHDCVDNVHGAMLEQAFRQARGSLGKEYTDFKYLNAYWLFDFALYMAIKRSQEGRVPEGWQTDLAQKDQTAIMAFAEEHTYEIEYYQFTQFLFFNQWYKVKRYAEQNGIHLIGEIPFYINDTGADAWARPELILHNGGKVCPDRPGQGYGVPYNWEAQAKNNYRWWMARIGHWLNKFHSLYIDRMADFLNCKVIAGNPVRMGFHEAEPFTQQGPGYYFNDVLRSHMPGAVIFSGMPERQSQIDYLYDCGIIIMRAMQEAFNPGGESYLPYNAQPYSAYTTSRFYESSARSWFLQADAGVKQKLLKYFGPFGPYSFYASFGEDNITIKLMRAAMESVAEVVIVPMSDVLNLTDREKLYYPGREDNWVWRMQEKDLDGPDMDRLAELTQTYGRC